MHVQSGKVMPGCNCGARVSCHRWSARGAPSLWVLSGPSSEMPDQRMRGASALRIIAEFRRPRRRLVLLGRWQKPLLATPCAYQRAPTKTCQTRQENIMRSAMCQKQKIALIEPHNIGRVDSFCTTLLFWDCECEGDYIHSCTEDVCPVCKATHEESPDARVDEVFRSTGLDKRLVVALEALCEEVCPDLIPIPF